MLTKVFLTYQCLDRTSQGLKEESSRKGDAWITNNKLRKFNAPNSALLLTQNDVRR
ncbi:uncharacterized protein PHALS_08875 [Plasmopara halstedii]|uniref:Uncharacterized protein n=1 Tax=Plasmopara halstedii TaxID=4781 RepID=A0A0P1ACW6_PLAHL|nr:uncharacterized protein PHALS_08875 [Plasmopara halstedii]CEG38824.1 hypothetical protein PHALS_08875 [Plasmopara halstedii]|eukprot:XP_024575193.1 hypothetical protein PHALS_08875 [Plasmopara halstedii]